MLLHSGWLSTTRTRRTRVLSTTRRTTTPTTTTTANAPRPSLTRSIIIVGRNSRGSWPLVVRLQRRRVLVVDPCCRRTVLVRRLYQRFVILRLWILMSAFCHVMVATNVFPTTTKKPPRSAEEDIVFLLGLLSLVHRYYDEEEEQEETCRPVPYADCATMEP